MNQDDYLNQDLFRVLILSSILLGLLIGLYICDLKTDIIASWAGQLLDYLIG